MKLLLMFAAHDVTSAHSCRTSLILLNISVKMASVSSEVPYHVDAPRHASVASVMSSGYAIKAPVTVSDENPMDFKLL